MNDFYQKYDIYCKNHTKKKISLKNVAKCDSRLQKWRKKHFSTLFLVAKRGGMIPKNCYVKLLQDRHEVANEPNTHDVQDGHEVPNEPNTNVVPEL